MVETVIQTTEIVEPHRRFDFWKDTVMATADVDLPSSRLAFDAHRSVARMAKGAVIDTSGDPLVTRRTQTHIDRDGLEQVCIAALLSGGGYHEQLQRNVQVSKGDCIIADLGRPMHLASTERYREVRLYIPRQVFNSNVGQIDRLAGLRLDRGRPLVDLFVGYLSSYASSLSTMGDAEADIGMDALLHLLKGVGRTLADVVPDGDIHLSSQVVLQLGDTFILDHIGDPGLDASMMIRMLGISRTKLYAAFACRGGVSAAIRDARLDRVRDRLLNRLYQGRTIEDIALGCRFTDYTSFSSGVSTSFRRDAAKRAKRHLTFKKR